MKITWNKLAFYPIKGRFKIQKILQRSLFIIISVITFYSCNLENKTILLPQYIVASQQNNQAIKSQLIDEADGQISTLESFALYDLNGIETSSPFIERYANSLQEINDKGKTDQLHDLIKGQTDQLSNDLQKWKQFILLSTFIEQESQINQVKTNFDQLISEIESIQFNNDTLNHYKKIKYWILKADNEYERSITDFSVIIHNHCLSYIKANNLKELFPKLEIQVRLSLIYNYLKDTGLKNRKQVISFHLDNIENSSYRDSSMDYSIEYIKFDQYKLTGNNKNDLKQVENFKKKYTPDKLPFNTYLNLLNVLAQKCIWIDSAKSFNYWNEIEYLTVNQPCNFQAYVSSLLNFYILQSSSKNELEIKKAQEKLDAKNVCFDFYPYLEYQNILYTSDLEASDSTKISQVKKVKRQREIAKELWGISPDFHLDDLYALNAVQFISSFHYLPEIDKSQFEDQLIQIIQETKQIELVKNRYFDKFKIDNSSKRLQELYKVTNDFSDTTYDSHSIYTEMYEAFERKIKSRNQENDNVNESAELNVSNIREKCAKESKVIIESIKHGNKYWLYVLDESGLETYPLEAELIDGYATKLRKAIETKSEVQAYVSRLKDLFPKVDASKDLVLLMDGYMNHIPFDLVYDQSIVYHHNLNQWLQEKEQSLNQFSVFSYTDEESLAGLEKRSFTELPFGMKESEKIRSLLGAQSVISGSDFTQETLKTNHENSLFHLSTHAVANSDNRLDNYLVIRDEDGKSKKLYSFEVENWKNSPRVWVLSACETGIGVHKTGAGIYSLSRSMFQAGAETVIKSLWSVNEKATASFMEMMYKKWLKGISISEALDQTKEQFETSSTYSHPYYWSGFVLEGNPDFYYSSKK